MLHSKNFPFLKEIYVLYFGSIGTSVYLEEWETAVFTCG